MDWFRDYILKSGARNLDKIFTPALIRKRRWAARSTCQMCPAEEDLHWGQCSQANAECQVSSPKGWSSGNAVGSPVQPAWPSLRNQACWEPGKAACWGRAPGPPPPRSPGGGGAGKRGPDAGPGRCQLAPEEHRDFHEEAGMVYPTGEPRVLFTPICRRIILLNNKSFYNLCTTQFSVNLMWCVWRKGF